MTKEDIKARLINNDALFKNIYFAFSIVIILLLNKSEFVNHFSQKC